jgi:hypothetical protein
MLTVVIDSSWIRLGLSLLLLLLLHGLVLLWLVLLLLLCLVLLLWLLRRLCCTKVGAVPNSSWSCRCNVAQHFPLPDSSCAGQVVLLLLLGLLLWQRWRQSLSCVLCMLLLVRCA